MPSPALNKKRLKRNQKRLRFSPLIFNREVKVKKYRRIEITAFRRRVTIVSGNPSADTANTEVLLDDADSSEAIKPESTEGQEILIEAARVLEQKLSDKARRAIFK